MNWTSQHTVLRVKVFLVHSLDMFADGCDMVCKEERVDGSE